MWASMKFLPNCEPTVFFFFFCFGFRHASNLHSSQVKSSLFKQGGPFSIRLVSIGALRN